jgi:hypothetical protein
MVALPHAHLCPLKEASRSRHRVNNRSLSSSDSTSPVSYAWLSEMHSAHGARHTLLKGYSPEAER